MSIFEALEAIPGHGPSSRATAWRCCLCIGAQSETIEAGAILHQVDPDAVVAELNGSPARRAEDWVPMPQATSGSPSRGRT